MLPRPYISRIDTCYISVELLYDVVEQVFGLPLCGPSENTRDRECLASRWHYQMDNGTCILLVPLVFLVISPAPVVIPPTFLLISLARQFVLNVDDVK